MASRIFRPSRLVAAVIVIGAAAWILSGALAPHEEAAEAPPGASVEPDAIPVQKVSVTVATPEDHSRLVTLSCVTKADRRASAVARGAGVIVELTVGRGARVTAGQVIATISDEGRTANVAQAQAALDQAQIEYDSRKRLIDRGDAPRNTLAALESGLAGAKAALAAAQAEADRSSVKAPISGVIDSVPFQVGQAVQAGSEIAVIIDPDPMLASGQVAENRRGLLSVGQTAEVRFIDGEKVTGQVTFVGLSAEKATRTYPVEATLSNSFGKIADGVTCEMQVKLAPTAAASVPRSALVFSDDGRLGVRIATEDNKAKFLPVDLVDDTGTNVWVTGIDQPARVIVVGQDFVKDGDTVEAVTAAEGAVAASPPA